MTSVPFSPALPSPPAADPLFPREGFPCAVCGVKSLDMFWRTRQRNDHLGFVIDRICHACAELIIAAQQPGTERRSPGAIPLLVRSSIPISSLSPRAPAASPSAPCSASSTDVDTSSSESPTEWGPAPTVAAWTYRVLRSLASRIHKRE